MAEKMNLTWRETLQKILRKPDDVSRRVALVGIGHELRGDDAAGLAVIRQLRKRPAVLLLEAATAPENLTGILRAFDPQIVFLIDAAELGQPAGTISFVDLERIDGFSASAHTIPLDLLARYLHHELDCRVFLIGIQPLHNELSADLSAGVRHAVLELSSAFDELLAQ